MADKEAQREAAQAKEQKRKIEEEKKRLKSEQRQQKKQASERKKELSEREAELDNDSAGSMVSVFFVTLFIVLIWLGILALVIKLDLGGFGTSLAAPILKDIPVLNKILPKDSVTETDDEEVYYGYNSLKDAVEQVRVLEVELGKEQALNQTYESEINTLKAEVERLKTFEDNQVEFQRVKTEFFEEVVYAQKGPGAEEYRKYYEEMDPETAQYLYKEVVGDEVYSKEVEEYAQAYSEMKPKEAAAIFEKMTDNLELAAKILNAMEADERGKILGVMDASVAARLTKIMEPDS